VAVNCFTAMKECRYYCIKCFLQQGRKIRKNLLKQDSFFPPRM